MCIVSLKVLQHLEDVHTVIYGDFLGCGMTQALFFPHGTGGKVADSAEDILSVVDAEMESAESDADGFGRRFLLTDFSQVNIDRWNLSTVFFSNHRLSVLVSFDFFLRNS